VKRSTAVIGSTIFFLAVPCVLGGVIPWWMTHWRFRPALPGLEWSRLLGALLIAAGLLGLFDSFVRFAVQGVGTPAPVAPTRRLVVTGLYRYVRNPMYVSVTAVIVGQAALFADSWLLAYGMVFWLACHLFVMAHEEPTLARRFGQDYEQYRANVPRWVPRRRPWQAP
jgi:protein-S-isoprenylcysteine O-methyltransferase Ste14